MTTGRRRCNPARVKQTLWFQTRAYRGTQICILPIQSATPKSPRMWTIQSNTPFWTAKLPKQHLFEERNLNLQTAMAQDKSVTQKDPNIFVHNDRISERCASLTITFYNADPIILICVAFKMPPILSLPRIISFIDLKKGCKYFFSYFHCFNKVVDDECPIYLYKKRSGICGVAICYRHHLGQLIEEKIDVSFSYNHSLNK